MSEVEVCFVTIVGDIAFAMFVGVERPWVDIDVGVKFLDGDAVATCL